MNSRERNEALEDYLGTAFVVAAIFALVTALCCL
jgi:hypothetical protein